MKRNLLLLAVSISLFSCSPNIVNTWNIDKYEVVNNKGQNTSAQNIGSIEFKKNGKGTKNISYNVFQNDFIDESSFKYELNEGYIIIKNEDEDAKDKSALNKTWIIVSDKKKNQVWKSTDGGKSVQIIVLSR
ncbi:lipocalin family protein [Mesonia sp. MT50]|uniref:Lipocalin family protein n=1 Tax=Mesonia profundi TaxID=3070998 RepID=A0ABU1A2B8_9FLAO|nr:lipocalin family protein [Mesonia profundi]MDQ7917774.1 lipocalin family protein [Mesonia profundi]